MENMRLKSRDETSVIMEEGGGRGWRGWEREGSGKGGRGRGMEGVGEGREGGGGGGMGEGRDGGVGGPDEEEIIFDLCHF